MPIHDKELTQLYTNFKKETTKQNLKSYIMLFIRHPAHFFLQMSQYYYCKQITIKKCFFNYHRALVYHYTTSGLSFFAHHAEIKPKLCTLKISIGLYCISFLCTLLLIDIDDNLIQ